VVETEGTIRNIKGNSTDKSISNSKTTDKRLLSNTKMPMGRNSSTKLKSKLLPFKSQRVTISLMISKSTMKGNTKRIVREKERGREDPIVERENSTVAQECFLTLIMVSRSSP
jgi:hypothetical protein